MNFEVISLINGHDLPALVQKVCEQILCGFDNVTPAAAGVTMAARRGWLGRAALVRMVLPAQAAKATIEVGERQGGR